MDTKKAYSREAGVGKEEKDDFDFLVTFSEWVAYAP